MLKTNQSAAWLVAAVVVIALVAITLSGRLSLDPEEDLAQLERVTMEQLTQKVQHLEDQLALLEDGVAQLEQAQLDMNAALGAMGDQTLAAPEARMAVVTASVLNIRAEPDLDAPIVGKMLRDAEIEVLAISGEWTRVNAFDRVQGWVYSEFLAHPPGADMALWDEENGDEETEEGEVDGDS